jgi:hypothetical protein
VEQFWVSNYYDSSSEKDLGNTLWAYGELGLQVWFPFFSLAEDSEAVQATKLMNRDNSLEFDLEVYPIGTFLGLSKSCELIVSRICS